MDFPSPFFPTKATFSPLLMVKVACSNIVGVACDVADRAQVEEVARVAYEQFGRIDTWINNAGVSIYGRLDEVSEEDR